MSTSGSFNTSAYVGSTTQRYLTFSWERTSYSIENNTTTISWQLKGAGGNSYTYFKAGNFSVEIDGTVVYSSTTRIELYNGTLVASGTYTFRHNNSGNRSFSASAKAGIYNSAANCTGSGSWDLDSIARASQPRLSSTTANFGTTITIYTDTASSAFKHKAYYRLASSGWTQIIDEDPAAGSGGQYWTGFALWTVPVDLMNAVIYSKSATVTIRLDTYSDISFSNKIGEKTTTLTATVPENDSTRPAVSLSTSPDNSLIPTLVRSAFDGMYIQGVSKVSATVSATGKYNAGIASYLTQIDGNSYNSAVFTSDFLTLSGSKKIVSVVKDTRGITNSDDTTVNVTEYSKPKVIPVSSAAEVLCYRSDESGSPTNNSNRVWVKAKKDFYTLDNKNSCMLRYRYKLGSEEWGNQPWTELQTTNNEYNALLDITLPVTNTYMVEIGVTDTIGKTSSLYFDIPTDDVPLHLGAGGKTVGIGRYADTSKENHVDIGWETSFDENVNMENDLNVAGTAHLGEVYISGVKVDYIIEQDTQGEWTYRKWHSGILEQWGRFEMNIGSWKSWGSVYESEHYIASQTYAIAFADVPTVNTTLNTADFGGWLEVGGVSTKTTTPEFYVVRPLNNVDVSAWWSVNIYAIGKWK